MGTNNDFVAKNVSEIDTEIVKGNIIEAGK